MIFAASRRGGIQQKIMKRPSGKKWGLRRFAQTELSYFSQFPQRTVAEFLCGGISDIEKIRNIIFFSLLQN